MIKGKLKSKYAAVMYSGARRDFFRGTHNFPNRFHPPPPPPPPPKKKNSLIEDLVTLSALEFFLPINDFVGCLSPLTDARQLFITRQGYITLPDSLLYFVTEFVLSFLSRCSA